MRRIIHIDMDAYYASVEQRDRPELRGKPTIVAWRGPRSVVCAASYEARVFGVRSAMPAMRAARLCPDAEFIAPDFGRYKTVSRQIHAIFRRYTDRVEPLSLDEAYLDVTEQRGGLGSATEVAEAIRAAIRTELLLTASAGVAPNKFLAKIASDWRKPDGLFVVPPQRVETFLEPLSVAKIPGVGKVTQAKLEALGVRTVGDLRRGDPLVLHRHLGQAAERLMGLAWGRDDSPVRTERRRKSLSAEDTFGDDRPLSALAPEITRLAEKVWQLAEREGYRSRTVMLKLKTRDFVTLTRQQTLPSPPDSLATFTASLLQLRERVDLPAGTLYRLVGVGFQQMSETPRSAAQSLLFDAATVAIR
ncbi:DNA polymerase IV [uncultured Abyssibacter sp.]|uniref:DNA polymerase IV n=1 Tax=uncultured Abyssibacter sp. TaxID=2320202 RepID=UPI0032B2FDD1